ncbi:MAG: hypothetical protein J2P36_04965 [Ktedonobacteraceae bacterium]|nr:hypothetical protein [Ktedonobacteraceae bacterium]
MAGKLQGVREARRMPWLKRGMIVDVRGKRGRVAGGNTMANIQVIFDGAKFSRNCHPQWETTYYTSDGQVIADYKKEAGE